MATNNLTDTQEGIAGFAYIYDQNGDGVIDAEETALRTKAHSIFAMINE